MSDDAVNLIFVGKDQLSETVKRIENRLGGIHTAVDRVNTGFGKMRGFVQGVAQGIGQQVWFQFTRILHDIGRIIPDLINRGKDWLGTVDAVADATGLAADKSSILAAQAQQLEVPIDSLGRLFALFSKNIRPNATLIEGLGVAVKDASGNTRDAAAIFYDLQRVIGSSNNGVDRAAILAKLFGRNWAEAADLLTAPPALLDAIAQHALATGQVVTVQQMQMRQDFERTQLALQGSLDGLGTNIFTSLAPALTGLINSIRVTIEQNMTAIVGFVSRVAGFVVGIISGLFGLNLELANFSAGAPPAANAGADLGNVLDNLGTKSDGASGRVGRLNAAIVGLDARLRALDDREQNRDAARQRQDLVDAIKDARRGADATDAYTRSIDRKIAAIDRELTAMDKRRRAQDNQRQRDEILSEISDLQAQLDEMKSTAVFTAGMSAVEAELARQRRAAEIVEQQKRISESRDRLADHDRDVAEQRRREELQRRREELEGQKRQHQELIASQKRLADAIDRLREFDHDQQVRRQRQALEDQRRHLQDQSSAVRGAAKDLKPLLTSLWAPPDLTKREGPLAGFADSVKGELQKALAEGRSFATQMRAFLFGVDTTDYTVRIRLPGDTRSEGVVNRQGSSGLFDKISQLITKLDGFVKDSNDVYSKYVKPVLDPILNFLGPGGVIALVALWKFGGPVLSVFSFLASALGTLATVVGTVMGGVQSSLTTLGTFIGGLPAAMAGALGGLLFPIHSFPGLNPNSQPGDMASVPGGERPGVFASPTREGRDAELRRLRAMFEPGSAMYRLLDDALGESQRNADNAETTALNTDRTARRVEGPLAVTDPGLGPLRDNTSTLWAMRDQTRRTMTASEAATSRLDAGVPVGGDLLGDIRSNASRTATSVETGVPATGSLMDQLADASNRTAAALDGRLNVGGGAGDPLRTDIVNPRLNVGGGAGDPLRTDIGVMPDVRVGNSPTVRSATDFITRLTGTPAVDVGTPRVAGINTNVAVDGDKLSAILGNTGRDSPLWNKMQSIVGNTYPLAQVKYTGTGNLSTSTATGTSPGGCFVYGTLVETPHGQRSIEEIDVGDMVIAVDVATMQQVAQRVLAVHLHPDNREPRVAIELDDGRGFEATVSHPLYDAEAGTFRPAREFIAGMTMRDAVTGLDLVITSIADAGDDPCDVADITVAIHHDYLIAGGLLVHNAGNKNAQGLLGMADRPYDVGVMGEAGREAIAIVRNPRPIRAGDAGGGGEYGGSMRVGDTVIPITLQLDGKVLTEVVTRHMYFKGGRSSTLRPS